MKIETKVRKMNVIIYTRVSTKEQVENYSLDSQEKICREYAEKQGWHVDRIFQEKGESAKTADRTELLNLIEYCRKNKGKIDVLLVYKFDRFSRSAADHHAVKAILLKAGVKVRSATELIDDTPGGKLMESIFSAIAQFDNDVRSDRTREGMREKTRQGQWAWKAPIGYKNSPVGMVVDEVRAPFIKKAFETYAQGIYTVKEITTKLNKWGLRTERGKKITPQSTGHIFINKLYMGVVEAWGEEHEGSHVPLITKELFYKVNSIRLGKSITASIPHFSKNPTFPLKNVLTCMDCGKHLTGSKSTGRSQKYAYYHCVCGVVRIQKQLLENNFYKRIKEIQPNNELVKLFRLLLVDVWKRKHAEASRSVEKIDKEITNLKNLKTKLLQKNLDGVVLDEDYKERTSLYNEAIAVKEIARTEYREQESSVDHLISLVETLFENVASLWFEANFENKQKFQQLIFPNGIPISNKGFGTASLAYPFKLIDGFAGNEEALVTLPEFESGFLG